MTARERLRKVWRELTVIDQLTGLLDWDQQTGMPAAAAGGRGEQAAWLGDRRHELLVSNELGDALAELEAEPEGLEAAEVERAGELRRRACRVPEGWNGEFARVTARAHAAWEGARAASDFAAFRPHLERIVVMSREYAGFFPEAATPYDALLDGFEPGLTSAEVTAVFTPLKAAQIELAGAIFERQAARPAPALPREFPAAGQAALSQLVQRLLGLDPARSRLDLSEHPFTVTAGYDDVRITTHYDEASLSSLFSTMHEAGHALYELNMAPELRYTALGAAPSLALHESQSRFWENMVGRSREWLGFLLPELRRHFPSLAGWDGEAFFRACNRVEAGLIRIDADEVTYNLHVMLRFELETALISGSLAVADLPGAWNDAMRAYLGVEVPDDARGVLQDVHWAGGAIGYFPTYAMGNLVAAQLARQLRRDVPRLDEQLGRGELREAVAWLAGRVHVHGGRYSAAELVRRVTGAEIGESAYLEYLRGKYLP